MDAGLRTGPSRCSYHLGADDASTASVNGGQSGATAEPQRVCAVGQVGRLGNPAPQTMTETQFRRIALALTGAVEGAHMGHPDFRASGRIFATLHGNGKTGMVKLTPEQQNHFVTAHP